MTTRTEPALALALATHEPAPALLGARGVDVTLAGQPILRGVDVGLNAGEVLALVGPNGAGKSTLLAVLAGDVEPEAGSVTLDGVDLRELSAAHLARYRAVQLQEARLSFAFTVAEVVAMGRAPWQGTAHEDRDTAVVDGSLHRTETAHLSARKFPTLSGGEKARTSFSRALAQETAVLMLDEPTAALDIRHQESVLTHARARARAGVGVVVVLHDLSLAAAYADRIVLLHHGQVCADGPPAQVLRPDLLAEVYGHPITVLDHPASGGLVVLPIRAPHQEFTP